MGNYVTKFGKVVYEYQFKRIEKSVAGQAREMLKSSLRYKGTNYFKVLLEGNRNIYYASPIYGHEDYNKSRVFVKTDKTMRILELFNKIVI